MTDTRLLVLGGTRFVGRALVAAGLERGWDVTVLNRGTRPSPDAVTQVIGDRTAAGGLDALSRGRWDLVIDTWASAPRVVRDSARFLADRAERYAYVSSRSVYDFPPPAGADESAPVVEASPDADEVGYAQDKRGGELAVLDAFGEDRTLLARAGLILGPNEDVGRLPWWLDRIDRGGPVMAPGPADLPLQYVDARDLAAFLLDASAAGSGGPFNVVSEPGHATMGELLTAAVAATGSDAELRWTDPQTILDAGAEPWTDLPVWLPPGMLHDAMHGSDTSRAHAAGLTCRPVAETVADTWAWMQEVGDARPLRDDLQPVGLAPDVEERILAAAGR